MNEVIERTKQDAWYVIGNTDNTEGRGRNVVLHACLTRATAIRLSHKKGVMGSDAHIEKGFIFTDNYTSYGKVYVENPSKADIAYQDKIDANDSLVEKAKQLGLSEEEIQALRYGASN